MVKTSNILCMIQTVKWVIRFKLMNNMVKIKECMIKLVTDMVKTHVSDRFQINEYYGTHREVNGTYKQYI